MATNGQLGDAEAAPPPAYPGLSEGGAQAAPPPAYDAAGLYLILYVRIDLRFMNMYIFYIFVYIHIAPVAAYNPAYNPAANQAAPVYNASAPQVGQPVIYQPSVATTQSTPQQPQQAQQVIYVNAQGQVIQPQQPQQQVIYVNAQGQPIQPQQQQQVMHVNTQGQRPQVVTQTRVVNQNIVVNQQIVDDDPACLYVFAVFGLFIWLIGAIGMCVYNCGNGLGPKRTQAFRVLCICTLIGFIWNVAYTVSGY